jgi:hypothetical protein
MLVCGQPVSAIVDTGSTTCAISLDFCESLGLVDSIHQTDVIYINADGVECHAPGILHSIPVKVGGMEQKCDALVIPGASYKFLCGIDFQQPARASINFVNRTLEFNVNKYQRGRVPITFTTTKWREPTAIRMLQADNPPISLTPGSAPTVNGTPAAVPEPIKALQLKEHALLLGLLPDIEESPAIRPGGYANQVRELLRVNSLMDLESYRNGVEGLADCTWVDPALEGIWCRLVERNAC